MIPHRDRSISSEESRSESPQPAGKHKAKATERGPAACTECRRHKIRCLPAENDINHTMPCSRCAKRSLPCEFLKHKRGRKKRIMETASSAVPVPLPSMSLEPESSDGIIPVRLSRFPFLASSRTSNVRSSTDTVTQEPAGVSLRSMLDSDDIDNTDSRTSGRLGGSSLVRDPVQEGLLTPDQGRALFNLFMLRINGAMSLLDPDIDTHDHVQQSSAFLFTAILCIASRYLLSLPSYGGQYRTPQDVFSVHQQIVVLARDHLTWAFADAASSLDVVRAIAFMSMWKEPNDDKPCFYFNRAVLLARELDLGRTPANTEHMTLQEIQFLRISQRVWLNLFMANTVYHLQFNNPILIDHLDPLVVNCHHWLRKSRPATLIMDTALACSVDLRRKCLHYRSLLQVEYSSALSLAVMTRTMNEDWEVTFEGWVHEIINVTGGDMNDIRVRKARVWASGLQLNLNLPVSSVSPNLPAIPAFHHCLNAATSLLMRVEALDRDHVSYASDTLLHFSLYAATLLWTLCRTPQLYTFNPTEISHVRTLILSTATALSNASLYPSDSPSLHAKYLRRLCADNVVQPTPRSLTPAAPEMVIDPPAIDLDVLLADFPWTGLDPPWNQLDGLWLGSETEWGAM